MAGAGKSLESRRADDYGSVLVVEYYRRGTFCTAEVIKKFTGMVRPHDHGARVARRRLVRLRAYRRPRASRAHRRTR